MFWTESALQELARLADKGLSAAEIAAHMGATRGQIVGKCYRLDLDLPYTQRKRMKGKIKPLKRRGRKTPSRLPWHAGSEMGLL
jgi:hypothetical protein